MAETLEVVLGRRLALARAAASMSQVALARTADLSVSMVSMVENGERMPTTRLQLKWAEACGTTLADVYEGLEAELKTRGTR